MYCIQFGIFEIGVKNPEVIIAKTEKNQAKNIACCWVEVIFDDEIRGPVAEIVAEPTYLDISIPPKVNFSHPIQRGHAAFAYVFEGQGIFGMNGEQKEKTVNHSRLVVFADGDYIQANTSDQPMRFLLISGKPLNEPIARYGPFVMNTQPEIEQALEDLKNGTFVKS